MAEITGAIRSKSDGCQGLADSSLAFTKTNFMSRIPNAQHLRRRTRANLGTSATAIIQRWKLLQFKPGALDDRYRRSTTLVLEHFAKNAGSRCRCEPPKIWLFGSFQHEQLRCHLSICLREKDKPKYYSTNILYEACKPMNENLGLPWN